MSQISEERSRPSVRPSADAPRSPVPAASSTPPSARLRGGRAAAIFVLLYALTFPWYLPRDWIDPTVWAFPAWGVVTVVGSIAIGAFTSWIYLFAWPEDPPQPQPSSPRSPTAGPDWPA